MSHMSYTGTMEVERDEPSLSEMTLAAIEVLRKNKNGYVLFIEGGRIDHAHHQNLVSSTEHDAAPRKINNYCELHYYYFFFDYKYNNVL